MVIYKRITKIDVSSNRTLIGHSLLNWSLGYVTATAVTITVMAEPVIATAAAISILGEFPPTTSVLGGVVILVGIFVALRPRKLAP